MSFVKLGEKIYNTDQILFIEETYDSISINGCRLHLRNGSNCRIGISIKEASKALGPSLIEIGKMYLDPSEVLAISYFTDNKGKVIENKTLIWFGSGDNDYFVVNVPMKEVVNLINKG